MTHSTITANPDTAPRVALDTLGALEAQFLGLPSRFSELERDEVLSWLPAPRSRQDRLSWSWDHRVGLGQSEGRTFSIEVGPGVLALASSDAVKTERAIERQGLAARHGADLAAQRLILAPTFPLGDGSGGTPSRVITEWSGRSRARMLRAFASRDFAQLARPGCVLAMVTLTYPGEWESVAWSGRRAKRHLANFRRRWRQALGWRLDGGWKLEFQRRGAPHFHLLCPVPLDVRGEPFRDWLSRTWADVVGHPDPVQRLRHEVAGTNVDTRKVGRFTDPQRLAVYFLKHGSKTLDDKEYQHTVPDLWRLPGAGPGRFWGIWGLPSQSRSVEVDMSAWFTVRRLARRSVAARRRGINYRRRRAAALRSGASPGAATRAAMTAGYQSPRSLGAGGFHTGGWVLLHDAPGVAGRIALWLRGDPPRGRYLP